MVSSIRASGPFAIISCLALAAACGGDDDGGIVTPVVDAAIDAPIDAAPPACNAPNMVCAGECVDVTSNEDFCGDCTTQCTGGQTCTSSTCACAPGFVPASVSSSIVLNMGGISAGIAPLAGAITNLAVIGYMSSFNAQVDTDYTLTGALTGPIAAAGYDVNIQTSEASVAYVATAGTLRFSQICKDANNALVGLQGTLTGATFSAVEDLFNPVPIPNGCAFDAPATVTFEFGTCAE